MYSPNEVKSGEVSHFVKCHSPSSPRPPSFYPPLFDSPALGTVIWQGFGGRKLVSCTCSWEAGPLWLLQRWRGHSKATVKGCGREASLRLGGALQDAGVSLPALQLWVPEGVSWGVRGIYSFLCLLAPVSTSHSTTGQG